MYGAALEERIGLAGYVSRPEIRDKTPMDIDNARTVGIPSMYPRKFT